MYEGNYRKRENFLGAELIGLDFDSGLSLDEALVRFKNYWHVIGTTRSHQKEKDGKPACDRFRVILRLDQVVREYKDYEHTVRLLLKENPEADPAAKDAARQFFPCREIISENYEGIKLSLVAAPPKEDLPQTVDGLKGALSKSTLEFLQFGAPKGERNQRLYKAARDFYQNGYTQDEFLAQSEHAFGLLNHTREKWEQTVESAFSKEPDYAPNLDEGLVEAAELVITPDTLILDTFNYLSNKDQVMGQPTGLKGIDKLLGGGLRGGELIGLVAQAGAGKSSLLHKIQVNLSLAGIPSGYLSQEMNPYSEVIPNYLSILCQENAWKEELTEERRTKYQDALKDIQVFFTKDRGHIPFEQIKNWMTFLNKAHQVKFFFLDHLAFCQRQSEDYAEASELIRSLKRLCTDLDVNLISIIQPQKLQFGQSLGLESMRGGAALNQACDLIMTMERESPQGFADPSVSKNISKIRTVKARHKLSRLGQCHIQYNPQTTDITDVEIAWEEKEL